MVAEPAGRRARERRPAGPCPPVRAEAARAVLATDPERGLDTLLESSIDGGRSSRRRAAVEASPERSSPPVRALAAASAAAAFAAGGSPTSIDVGEDDRLDVLRESLLASSRAQAHRARAIALLDDAARVETALDSLAADDPRRANALEAIETAADRDVVRPLVALWEPERTHDPDPDWREHALEHRTNDPRHGGVGDERTRDARPHDADEGGPMTETLTTLPTMERAVPPPGSCCSPTFPRRTCCRSRRSRPSIPSPTPTRSRSREIPATRCTSS